MTQLLVSVRSLDEALDAFDAGADIIDLKEPLAGSLGRVADVIALQVTARLGGRSRLSIALGELAESAPAASAGCDDPLTVPDTIAFAKLGLAGCAAMADWPARWQRAVRGLPARCAPVAVIYADWRAAQAPPPEEVLEQATRLACRALLIDTYHKNLGSVFDHLTVTCLGRLIASARSRELVTVLAGSLTLETVREALQLRPDFLAVRGAVCGGARQARLMPEKVRQWKALCRSGIPA